jgi:hypothetical protein
VAIGAGRALKAMAFHIIEALFTFVESGGDSSILDLDSGVV